ncbi:hypothetical protein [Wenjunlia tyrosinilytica]|uniref:hypothetical protein n=1 Tax=Wenjunlia tyrosinilytica TaxID=1544741 RepID=UPI00166B16D1|nr:hypothetical protein [Wenjunlia tyrosinilytica]
MTALTAHLGPESTLDSTAQLMSRIDAQLADQLSRLAPPAPPPPSGPEHTPH